MHVSRSSQGWLARGSFGRRLVLILAAALCALGAIAVWVLISGHLDAAAGRVLLSTFAAAACALAGLVGAAGLDREDARRRLGLVTVLLSAVVLVLALVVIWATQGESEALNRGLGVSAALLAGLVHAGLMLGRLRADDGSPARRLTAGAVVFSSCAWLLVAGAFAVYHGSDAGVFWRVLGVLAVLATLSTLLTPIVRRLGRAGREHRGLGGGQTEPGRGAQPEDSPGAPRRPGGGASWIRRDGLVHRGHAA